MKIIKSTPTNHQILNTYGGLLKVTSLLILFSICISSLTEMGVGYSFFDSKFSFMGYFGIFLTIVFTMAFVLLLEGGGKLSLSYSIDFFLYQRWKDKGLELILGIIVIATTILIYATSVSVSLKGSPTVVKSFEEKPNLLLTNKIDSLLNIEKNEIRNTFSNDSLLIAQSFNTIISNIQNEYQSRIEKVKIKISNYIRKEQRTGKSYISQINKLKGNIALFQTIEAQKKGKIENDKSIQFKALIKERKENLKNILDIHKTEKGKIENENNNLVNDYKTEIVTSSKGLGNLILICLPILFLSVLVQRIIYKKSGIQISYHFSDYYFRDSIFNVWLNFVEEKIQEKAHSKIYKWHSKVKEVKLNDRPLVIFDRVGNTQYVKVEKEETENVQLISLNSNVNYDEDKYQMLSDYIVASNIQDSKLQKVSNLEKKTLELIKSAKAQREIGNEEKAKEIEMKAKHVIKAFFETDFTPNYSKKLGRKFRVKLEGYLDGINSNPFDDYLPLKRRQIGFNMKSNKTTETYERTDAEHGNNYYFYGDKHTVPHKQENGKIVHVNMSEILSKINLYSGRVSDSYKKLEKYQKRKNKEEIKRQSKALVNREEKLNYWNKQKEYLLNQLTKQF